MTSSATPQDRAVQALHDKYGLGAGVLSAVPLTLADMLDHTPSTSTGPSILDFRCLRLGEILDCLADAGLLSSGTQEDQGDGSLRSEPPALGPSEADIELVAESLRDFRLRLGPNTVRAIRDGQDSVPLSGRERRDVARVAVEAVRSLEET